MRLAIAAFFLALLLYGQERASYCVTYPAGQVARLRYAIELHDELRRMKRLCEHAEDWDKTMRAIADGAPLVEIAVCHHDKKSRITTYRVTARWLQVKDYPSASVVEGVERQP